MCRDWTIDTYVLHKAADVDLNALEFLNHVLRQKHRVTLDHEGCIAKEYRRCLEKAKHERKGGREALGKWFREVVNKLAQGFSGRLYERHKRKFKELEFDKDDWPFVAVCSKTQSRELVTGDSDYYKENVKCYLQSEMGINVMSIRDSLEK